jgi:hypothetical protein
VGKVEPNPILWLWLLWLLKEGNWQKCCPLSKVLSHHNQSIITCLQVTCQNKQDPFYSEMSLSIPWPLIGCSVTCATLLVWLLIKPLIANQALKNGWPHPI